MFDTTFATPKAGITYSIYSQYEEPKKVCGNCKHWQRIKELPEYGYCQHPDMPAYVQGGLIDPVKSDFGCVPLWEESESTEGE